VLVNKAHNKTPYELFSGRTPAIGFLKPFGCHVMILNTLDNLGKFEPKGDEGYFLRYSMSSKAFRVFNKRTKRVEENVHIEFLENKAIEKGSGPNWLFDIDSLTKSINFVPVVDVGTNSTNFSGTKVDARKDVKKDVSSLRYIVLPNRVHEEHLESISSQPQDPCNTDAPESSGNSNPTATSTNLLGYQVETLTVETPIPTVSSPVPTVCFTDSQEPSSETRLISKRVTNQAETFTEVPEGSGNLNPTASTSNPPADQMETLTAETPIPIVVPTVSLTVESEILTVSSPVPTVYLDISPKSSSGPRLISKGVFSQKESPSLGNAWTLSNRLVAQGYTQEEGIDYEEVFASVARIKAIRLFLAYASFIGFIIYQMDVKSVFLYGTIDEEAPRAWYGTLSKYLLDNGFQRGTIDQILFIKKYKGEFLLLRMYVDDIKFGSSNLQLCREFEALMHDKFQMSAMGELTFFLSLQVLQKKDGIFLSQDKYVGDILKKFGYSYVRSANTPMDKENLWGKDGPGKDVELHLYRSMIGSLMYITASRPDIMFASCACARHKVTPKECHLHAVKRIFRYLKGYVRT
nr:hypothetical protein [Tanacetum cinerariifolium]